MANEMNLRIAKLVSRAIVATSLLLFFTYAGVVALRLNNPVLSASVIVLSINYIGLSFKSSFRAVNELVEEIIRYPRNNHFEIHVSEGRVFVAERVALDKTPEEFLTVLISGVKHSIPTPIVESVVVYTRAGGSVKLTVREFIRRFYK
jgi:hypothetical protein